MFKFKKKEQGYPVMIGEIMITTPPEYAGGKIDMQVIVPIPSNGGDIEFLATLTNLGIEILDYNEKAARVMLPAGWIALGHSETEEAIYDQLGRKRIMTKVISLQPFTVIAEFVYRFSFEIEKVERDIPDGKEVVCFGFYVKDCGKVIESKEIDKEEYYELLERVYNHDSQKFHDKLIEEGKNFLNESFPGWDDPTNYW